jgi:hypothetical protein
LNSQLKAGLRFSNARGTVSWQTIAEKRKERKWQNQRRKKFIGGNNTRSSLTRTRILATNTTCWRIGRASKRPKYPGKPFEEIEDEVALDYERNKAGSALPWDHARHAVHAAWAKLSGDIGPRDSDRGIRSGF